MNEIYIRHSQKFDTSIQTIAYYSLIIFCLTRPICSLDFPELTNISFLRVSEYYNMVSSYVFLIIILLGIRYIKWDFVDVLLILMIIYTFVSILWGSLPRETFRIVFPTFLFFLTRLCHLNKNSIINLVKSTIIPYALLMLINTVLIAGNLGVHGVNYWSGIKRYQGLYEGPHTFAHEAMVFVFFIVLYHCLMKTTNIEIKGKLLTFILFIGIIAIYNLFKSYTRTVYLGFVTFGSFYILGMKKYIILLIPLLLIFIIAFQSNLFKRIFVDVIAPIEGQKEIETMGSGRIGVWKQNLEIYLNEPERYLIGFGLGKETVKNRMFFGASHNDLLSILYSLGLIGIILYLSINVLFLYEVISVPFEKSVKFYSIGFIFSILFMNLLSNSYVNRFQLAQYAYFIMGLIFSYKELFFIEINRTQNSHN